MARHRSKITSFIFPVCLKKWLKERFHAKKILKNCTIIHLKVNYYSIVRTVKTQAPPGSVLTFTSKHVLLVSILNWMLSEQMARKHCRMYSMKHFQMLFTRDNILTKLHAVHVPKRFSACLSSFKDVQYGVTFTLIHYVLCAWLGQPPTKFTTSQTKL